MVGGVIMLGGTGLYKRKQYNVYTSSLPHSESRGLGSWQVLWADTRYVC